MASIQPPRGRASCFLVDGLAADNTLQVARRRDIVAKRARDEDLRPEADARGWSSALPERILALRRRRGSVPLSFARTTTSVEVPEQQRCSGEVASSAVLPIEPQAEGIATFMGSDWIMGMIQFFTISSGKLRPQEGSCGSLLCANALGHVAQPCHTVICVRMRSV